MNAKVDHGAEGTPASSNGGQRPVVAGSAALSAWPRWSGPRPERAFKASPVPSFRDRESQRERLAEAQRRGCHLQPRPLGDPPGAAQEDLPATCSVGLSSEAWMKARHLLWEPPEPWDPGSCAEAEPIPHSLRRWQPAEGRPPPLLLLLLPDPPTTCHRCR